MNAELEDALDLVLYIYDCWGKEQEDEYPPNFSGYQIAALKQADKNRADGARTALSQVAWELYRKLHPGDTMKEFQEFCERRRAA